RGNSRGEIVLEHTSANPDGPLHIGHGRNAIIGDTLSRILRFAGYKVETQFYVNDMGKQLAVVVWGLRKFKLDKRKKSDSAIAEVYIQANKMLEADSDRKLARNTIFLAEEPDSEKEISEMLKGYEAGGEIRKEFEEAAKYCIKGMVETLERLNIKHDTFVWESSFVRDSSVNKIVDELKRTKFARKGEVLSLDLSSFGIEKELVLTRKDGTYLYTTRDIAHHVWKGRHSIINVWGADHKLVAEQLKAVLKILGQKEPEFIIYEFISLPEGGMSTRRGVFVSLDELIEESVKRAYVEVDKRRKEESEEFKKSIAESVGVGAVRYNIIKVSPEKSMVFKWEEALDFERQGSPFIQYAYARACRILEKAEVGDIGRVPALGENEKSLLKIISKFPVVVEECANTRKASPLAGYALELANAFHRFYMFEPVLKSKKKEFMINLVEATKITLRNALNLLGIKPLERM
ncbi:MAG: arginine--tRNA ligase, partial [Candidatus Hydrothermarchaeota archaeon]|nr:arginine--tRNA ligase [Candidatus Hydrothermarchaeota archaeon]